MNAFDKDVDGPMEMGLNTEECVGNESQAISLEVCNCNSSLKDCKFSYLGCLPLEGPEVIGVPFDVNVVELFLECSDT